MRTLLVQRWVSGELRAEALPNEAEVVADILCWWRDGLLTHEANRMVCQALTHWDSLGALPAWLSQAWRAALGRFGGTSRGIKALC